MGAGWPNRWHRWPPNSEMDTQRQPGDPSLPATVVVSSIVVIGVAALLRGETVLLQVVRCGIYVTARGRGGILLSNGSTGGL